MAASSSSSLLGGFDRWFTRVEHAFTAIALLAMALIMLLVGADVFARYVSRSPILWSIDVVSRYLMVAMFYLSISYTLRHEDHIRVTFFRHHFPARFKAGMDAALYLLFGVVMAVVAYRMSARTYQEWVTNELTIGQALWPNWSTTIIVAIGCWMIAIRLLLRSAQRLADLPQGRLDPIVDSEHIEDAL
jgi:TRAP-type C4-dicarboxylate transport system permease small subunit